MPLHFERQPFVFCGGERGLGFFEPFRLFVESFRVAREQRLIGEGGLQHCNLRCERVYPSRQRFEREFLLIGEFCFRCRGRRCLRPFLRLSAIDGAGRGGSAALREHIVIAAHIFRPLTFRAGRVGRNDRRHRPVEKATVMADDEEGPLIVGDEFFQQIERFKVEIIGRLVEHEEV